MNKPLPLPNDVQELRVRAACGEQFELLFFWGHQSSSDGTVTKSVLSYVWGIGLRQDDPRSADPTQWQGSNLLGFALMAVRDDLCGSSDSNTTDTDSS